MKSTLIALLAFCLCLPLMADDQPSVAQKLDALEKQLRELGFSEEEIKEAVQKARKKNEPKNPELDKKLAALEKQLKALGFSDKEIKEKLTEARQKHMGGKPLPNGIEQLKAKAEQGDVGAQSQLGELYYTGKGVLQDHREAAKWWRKAAEQGDTDAQMQLGALYYIGEGVLQDRKEAVKWYRKAAEQGDAEAQYSLGAMYALGEGVEKNFKEAYRWSYIAFLNKNNQKDDALKGFEKRINAQQKAEAEMEAESFWVGHYLEVLIEENPKKDKIAMLRELALKGDVYAQVNLGAAYMGGDGLPKKLVNSYTWLKISEINGSKIGKYLLGEVQKRLNREEILTAEGVVKVLRNTQPNLLKK